MKTTALFLAAATALLFPFNGVCDPDNLLKGGALETPADLKSWELGHWVHIPADKGDYRILIKEVAPFVSRDLADGGKIGKNALKLTSKAEFLQIKDNDGGDLVVSNYLYQTAPAKPGKYLLTVWMKGKNGPAKGYNAVRCFINLQDVGKKAVNPGVDRQFALTPDWVQQKIDFTVPEKGASLTLRFSLYGVGELFLDDVVVKPLK